MAARPSGSDQGFYS